jgi:hypothetical protein
MAHPLPSPPAPARTRSSPEPIATDANERLLQRNLDGHRWQGDQLGSRYNA